MKLFKLIYAQRASYPVSLLLCRVLKVLRSGYYETGKTGCSPEDGVRENVALTEQIVEIHQRSRGTYGYPHGSMRSSKLWEYAAPSSGSPD